jgi:tetratricopeptide (TPR) repeat protein
MLSDTIFRLPSLGVCLAVLAAGCGTREMPAVTGPDRLPAPRQIELPPDIRPLLSAESGEEEFVDANSVPAQYQQPAKSAEAHVVGISPSTSTSGSAIREPLAGGPIATMAAAPPQRSEFVPIALPEQEAAPVAAAVPKMATEARFAAASTATAGPELGVPNREAPVANDRDFKLPEAMPTSDGGRGGNLAVERSQTGAWERENSPIVQPVEGVPAQPIAQPRAFQPTGMMQAATQRAMQMANQASSMAQRGMLFSAKAELIKALTLISQTLDVEEGSTMHATALTAGLAALNEAKDFARVDGRETVNVATIAKTHRTALPTALSPDTNPMVAQQSYFAYAQAELEFAAGGAPAASEILHRLGRLQTALAASDTDPVALHAPQAIVFHQAALATDGNNWLAANELGVLYARYGQLQEARQFLVRSVSTRPNREGWHNLAVVHRRLGETDLAQRAEAERLALERQGVSASGANEMVRWVDPKTFAASGGGDVNWPTNVASKGQTAGTTRR